MSLAQPGPGKLYFNIFDAKSGERILFSKDNPSSKIFGYELKNEIKNRGQVCFSKTIHTEENGEVFGPVLLRRPINYMIIQHGGEEMVLELTHLPSVLSRNLLVDSIAFIAGDFILDSSKSHNDFVKHPYFNKVWDITPEAFKLENN